MVEAGRLTEEEAERLRGAANARVFDDAVLEIRVRHARARLDEAVGDGRLTQNEADALLERVEHGEHPRTPLELRRPAPPREGQARTTLDRGDTRG